MLEQFNRQNPQLRLSTRLLRSPTFLGGSDDRRLPAAESFRFGFGVASGADGSAAFFGSCPSLALCVTDAFPGGSTHFPAFPLRRSRRGCGFSGATKSTGGGVRRSWHQASLSELPFPKSQHSKSQP